MTVVEFNPVVTVCENEQIRQGTLAHGLFVSVRSALAPVAEFLASTGRFELESSVAAAEISVIDDPAAPRKRFTLDEYYTRIVWHTPSDAVVQTNGARGSITWSGEAEDVLRAELRIFPQGAPESLGSFLRLVASLLLPSRRGVLVHASAVVVQGDALLFLGESGAGKTTTARRAGREGAMRIADDIAVVRIESEHRVIAEACNFDRGGRLPGRATASWPVRGVYDVRKGAPKMQVGGLASDPLATWCASIISSTGPPRSLNSLLSLTFALARALPPQTFHVSPSGSVVHPLTSRLQHDQIPHASSDHQ